VALCWNFSAEMTERVKAFRISGVSTAPDEYIPIALFKHKMFDFTFL